MKLGFGLSLVGQRTAGGAAAFTPASLFASGEEGVWCDIHPNYLFQNSNGTGAVTVGDPVGYVTDRSGNGNHLVQATSAARPTLRQTAGGLYYLEFDGVDDRLRSSAFSLSQDHSIFYAGRIASPSVGFNNAFWSFVPSGSNSTNVESAIYYTGSDYRLRSQYDGLDSFNTGMVLPTAGNDFVIMQSRAANNAVRQRANGSEGAGFSPTITDFSVPREVRVGQHRNVSQYMNGRLYGLVCVDGVRSADEIADVEAYLADVSGVTL